MGRSSQPATGVAVANVEKGCENLDCPLPFRECSAPCRHAGRDGIRIGMLDQKSKRFFLAAEIVIQRAPRDIDDVRDGDHRQMRVAMVQERLFQP